MLLSTIVIIYRRLIAYRKDYHRFIENCGQPLSELIELIEEALI